MFPPNLENGKWRSNDEILLEDGFVDMLNCLCGVKYTVFRRIKARWERQGVGAADEREREGEKTGCC